MSQRGSERKSAASLFRTEGNMSLTIALWVLFFLSRVQTKEGEMWSIHLLFAGNSIPVLGEAWVGDQLLTTRKFHVKCLNCFVGGLELVQKWEGGTDRFRSDRCINHSPKPLGTFLLYFQGPIVFCRSDESFRFLRPVVIFGAATSSEGVPSPLHDVFDEWAYPWFVGFSHVYNRHRNWGR